MGSDGGTRAPVQRCEACELGCHDDCTGRIVGIDLEARPVDGGSCFCVRCGIKRPPQLSAGERLRRAGGFTPLDRLDALHGVPTEPKGANRRG